MPLKNETPTINYKCQVFTPDEVVIKILDSIKYSSNLYGKTVVDHSCGDGQFLKEVVRRYIYDCYSNLMPIEQINLGLSRDVWGAELDSEHYSSCIRTLNELTDKLGVGQVSLNIYNFDSLQNPINQKFNYVVGNPPYLSYWDITEGDRKYIREKYPSCKKGAFDYCFAFIEEGISLLNETGVLIYIIPNSVFKTKAAKLIRDRIEPLLKSVYDYRASSVFDEVLTSSAVIELDKQYQSDSFLYHDHAQKKTLKIMKNTLGNAWIFRVANQDEKNTSRRFGDYFKVSSSVATQYNKAFVISDWTEDGIWLRNQDGEQVEKDATWKAASPKGKIRKQNERIIFPYYFKDGERKGYSEDSFSLLFPYAYKYLKLNKEKLQLRKSDVHAKWFEYGRSQALNHVQQQKILLSTVVTNRVKVFELDNEEIPFSGIYIVPKKDLSISHGVQVLESADFLDYVESIGININGNSLRITAENISDYRW